MGSTRTLVTLLRPWIKCFTMIIPAWWLHASSKFNGQEFEESYPQDHWKLLRRFEFSQARSSQCYKKLISVQIVQ